LKNYCQFKNKSGIFGKKMNNPDPASPPKNDDDAVVVVQRETKGIMNFVL
jgi:hypothetical protein